MEEPAEIIEVKAAISNVVQQSDDVREVFRKHLLFGQPGQGGTCCASVRAALTERSGSSTKGRTPNIRYFVAKPSIVAIYALFERLSQGFQRKPSCFHRAYYESHLAFEELSTKAILLS